MFENRINSFAPNMGAAGFTPGVFPMQHAATAQPNPLAIQINDIYQAAVKRSIEEHEIDKLFNPDPDDFQI
jgi:hypothetical protein